MDQLFRYRDRWGNGLALWVTAFVLFTLPLLFVGIRHLRLENDVTRWLPQEDPDAKILDWFYREFEHDSRILFSWDSSVVNDPRIQTFRNLVLAEANGKKVIPGVEGMTTPVDVLARMLENGIPEQVAVDRMVGVLVGRGFLKIRLTPHARETLTRSEQLVQKTAEEAIGKPVTVLPRVVIPKVEETVIEETVTEEADEEDRGAGEPDAETIAQAAAIEYPMPEHDFQLRWPAISSDSPETARVIERIKSLRDQSGALVEEAFFQNGAPVAVSISLNDYGDDNLTETIQAIENAAAEAGIPADEIRMGGSPIGRHRLNRSAVRAVWNREYPLWNFYKRSPVLLSAIVGILSSFVMLRSIRLSLLVVAAALYACLAVLVLVPATGKSLNIVLVVLPDLLLVLTMSGAIHVANYWKYAASRQDPYPVATAVKMAWQPCLLASMTTAIGMASLITAVLNPVREFGIYSSLGCLVSLVVILIVFPSLLSLWPDRKTRQLVAAGRDEENWGRLGGWIVRHRVVINLACLVLFVVSVLGLQRFRTETKVIRYFPAGSRVVQDYDYLEEALAGIVSIEGVIRFDNQAQEQMTVLDRMELVRGVEAAMAGHRWVSGTLSLADFRPSAEPPPENASTRAKILYRRRAQRTDEGIFKNPSESTRRFARKVDVPLSVTSRGRKIDVHTGDEIWRVRAQASVMGDVDYATLTRELNQLVKDAVGNRPGTEYIVTGMVPLFLRTQNAVLESLIESFVLAFGVIALIMMILLRNPISGLLAMIPNLFPVGVVFGLVSWGRIPVDIGTMITASVALGIAIDGTLHLLTWFQEGIREGLSREAAVSKALGHCGPAMWQTSVSISLGIVMLSGAELLLIHRFGWLMAALIMVALLADVVLLPAMLGGWLGRIIEHMEHRRMQVQKPVKEQEPVPLPG